MSSDRQELETFLKVNNTIKFIRLQWVDFSGVMRVRFVPIHRCIRIADGLESVHFAQNSMITPISTAPRIFSPCDYHDTWTLSPDWSSLRPCGFKMGHATVMSFVSQDLAQTPRDKCPRTLLVDTVHKFEREWGAQILIGFEIEFVLLDGSNNIHAPLDRLVGYSRPAGLRSATLNIMEEIVDALSRSSITIHHFHAEIQDQLEIALSPGPVIETVDALLMAQETIRTICIQHNLKASMTPKPTVSGPTNGLHLHLSLDTIDPRLAEPFLAGTLTHAGALCAFGMANYDGPSRSVDDAAGAWIGYGTDNRDMPVRRISDLHWEFRILDATANPYLFVAAVLLAGLDGLSRKLELTWKDCRVFPPLMDEERRKEYGIVKVMPKTFKDALDRLKEDHALRGLFPEDMLKWYISVKDHEVEEFAKMTDEERRSRFLDYF